METNSILKQLEALSWQETFDAMSDFVAVMDRDFRIVKANKAMAEFLKRSPDELIGFHCYELMHGKNSHWPNCPHAEMLKKGVSVTNEINDPHIGVPLLVTASPVFDDRGNLLGSIHVAKDISELKNAYAGFEDQNRKLSILWSVGRSAQRSLSMDDVIQSAMEGLRTALYPDQVLFYLKDGDTLFLRGFLPLDAANLNEQKKVGVCLCGLAAEDGHPVFSKDINDDARCTLTECKAVGIRSFAALPLLHEDEIIGVIGIASKKEQDFSMLREFLETIVATVTVAARNALLFESLRMHSQSLEKSVKERNAELERQNAELERFNRLFVDREFRIKELKERVKELEGR